MGNKNLKNVKICKKCGRFYKANCKCSPVWNKGLTKNTNLSVLKYSKKQEGMNNSMYGKMKGYLNPNYNNNQMNISGYIYINRPNHPRAKKNGKFGSKYIPKHVLVMEKHLGRYLINKEVVHHINGNKKDNRIKNLILCKNQSEHRKLHNMSNIDFSARKDLNKYMREYRHGKRYRT